MYKSLSRNHLRGLTPLLIFTCLLGSNVIAYPSGSPPPPGPDTSLSNDIAQIIEEARTRHEALKDFSADFTYSLSYPGERHSAINGSLIYSDSRYVVKLPEQQVYCDGNARWYHFLNLKEVVVREYEPEIGITMSFQVFRKGKEPRYEGKDRINGKLCDVVFFNSMAGSAYQQAKVWIDLESRLIHKIILYFENQGSYTFVFSNIRVDQGFKDADFQFPFQQYPGVNVVDDRLEK